MIHGYAEIFMDMGHFGITLVSRWFHFGITLVSLCFALVSARKGNCATRSRSDPRRSVYGSATHGAPGQRHPDHPWSPWGFGTPKSPQGSCHHLRLNKRAQVREHTQDLPPAVAMMTELGQSEHSASRASSWLDQALKRLNCRCVANEEEMIHYLNLQATYQGSISHVVVN